VTNNLVVDGSNKTKDVVHFMLTKPIVLQIASQHGQQTSNATAATNADATDNSTSTSSIMNFSLIPSETGSKSTGTPMNMTDMMMPSP
nr:hypothetical protein [Nitrosopumilus sp.]